MWEKIHNRATVGPNNWHHIILNNVKFKQEKLIYTSIIEVGNRSSMKDINQSTFIYSTQIIYSVDTKESVSCSTEKLIYRLDFKKCPDQSVG